MCLSPIAIYVLETCTNFSSRSSEVENEALLGADIPRNGTNEYIGSVESSECMQRVKGGLYTYV